MPEWAIFMAGVLSTAVGAVVAVLIHNRQHHR